MGLVLFDRANGGYLDEFGALSLEVRKPGYGFSEKLQNRSRQA